MEHTASRLDVHPALRSSDDVLRRDLEPRRARAGTWERAEVGATEVVGPDDAAAQEARDSAAARGYAVRMLVATFLWAAGGGILASAPRTSIMACAAVAVAIGIALALDARRRLYASLVGNAVGHGTSERRAEAQAEATIDRIDGVSREPGPR